MNDADMKSRTVVDKTMEQIVMRKVAWRLIPFMALMYAFNMLDRTNVAVAAMTMKNDLGFSDKVYGFGAGIFFLGYFTFEIPSNLIMERVGARRWIARIMLTWGLVSAGMMFINKNPNVFYGMRFLLGVAEAGFYPGMILYMTYWFPTHLRGRAVSRFVAINSVLGLLGGPLGAKLLQLDGMGGLKGWQWLFLLEGLPSFFLGFFVLFFMTDRPETAHWLKPDEREWLVETMNAERREKEARKHYTLAQALSNPTVLHFCVLFFLIVVSGYGMSFWSNLIIKDRTHWTPDQVTQFLVIPGVLGALSMIIVAAHSDKTGERRFHLASGLMVGAAGIALSAYVQSPIPTLIAFCIAAMGQSSMQGPFWAIPTSLLSGPAAAGGIAMINSVGNLGGFAGPYLMGYLKESTGNYAAGMYALAGILVAASIMAALIPHRPAKPSVGLGSDLADKRA